MDQNKTALERAFELARTGRYPTVELIRRAISAEGYFQNQLEGRDLTRQLRALIAASTPADNAAAQLDPPATNATPE